MTERRVPLARQRLKPYPAYKASGVEWLGEIPAHWEVKRLKTIAAVQLSNVDKKSVAGQESVRLCNYVDVYYSDRIGPDLDFMAATATPESFMGTFGSRPLVTARVMRAARFSWSRAISRSFFATSASIFAVSRSR